VSSPLPSTDDRTLDRRAFLLGAAASLAPGRDRLLIDTHLEVWTHDPRFPFHHPERPALKPREAAPIENQVSQMADFGIKYAVLINPRYYGWDNSYISDCLRRYPKLFVAHGLIDPRDPRAPERLRSWVQQHRFQGMRFSPQYHPDSTWLNARESDPLWREAERLGVVFNFYILPHQMPMLADMAARFPGVKIVVDHLGKPDLRKPDPWPEFRKMFELKRFPQVWISASEPYELSISGTFPYRDTIPFFKAVYEEFGGKKLIWGTGYPRPRWELPMDKELEFVEQVLDFYTPEDRSRILGRNALDIWRFPSVPGNP
jgi:predicted TIM-barrel fold metal-dependent hydrolase